jgi:hypothetical protein
MPRGSRGGLNQKRSVDLTGVVLRELVAGREPGGSPFAAVFKGSFLHGPVVKARMNLRAGWKQVSRCYWGCVAVSLSPAANWISLMPAPKMATMASGGIRDSNFAIVSSGLAAPRIHRVSR